jgi:MinD superfamily P-loop ATPase
VAVLSGKGGTGKTSVAAALAHLAGTAALADCDVDAANLALLMPGTDGEGRPFVGGRIAEIRAEACNGCGACTEACRFGAIGRFAGGVIRIDPVACEGCGVCDFVCPVDAVTFTEPPAGVWWVRETAVGPLVHARLGPGRSNSGRLVAVVRQEAERLAVERGIPLVILDGPPGIGCPVHATLTGVESALFVAEPSISGEHDLARALELAERFRVPTMAAINKADVAPAAAERIERMCRERNCAVAGRIPFDPEVSRRMGEPVPSLLAAPGAAAAMERIARAVLARAPGESDP